MSYRNIELYLNRAREALLRLAVQRRLEEALPVLEQLEELAVEDSSESGLRNFSTLGRDEPLPAIQVVDESSGGGFLDAEDTGVLTSALPIDPDQTKKPKG